MADTPNIRFRGFIDDWEQRKLVDVCDYVDYRGKTPLKTEVGIFLVTAKNVKDGYIDYESSKEYISEDSYEEVMHRGKSEIGDVIITTEAPCGNVAQINKENIALAQRIIKYRGHNNVVDNTYLKYYLLSPEFQKVLRAKSSGGTVQGIKGSILHQQTIQYPLYEEQVKIGQYMQNLDNLITLHRCKCDEIKELKKYMLQKMFPQKGKKIPEIRFKGFIDDWEQRKIKYVAPLQRGFDLPVTQMENGLYPVIMSNGVGGYHSKFKVKGPGVVTGRSGTIGKLHYIEDDYWPHNTSLWVTDFKGNFPKFIYYLYQKLDLSRFGSGSGVPTLNRNDVHDALVEIPKKNEQQLIAEYFTNLDNLIILHQRKRDELKEAKKFTLQNMFPQKG